jgi:hypothetical protein
MNTEERQLADVLHRVTPEPARPVTVEQVAYRLVSQPRLGRPPRLRRGGLGLSRALAPAAAAAAVIVIAGASAGIAVLASSHHHSTPPAGGAPTSSSLSSAPVSSSPSPTPSSTGPVTPAMRIVGGPWGAELIDHQTLDQDSLVSGNGSLYAYTDGFLDRIDPVTGTIAASAPYNPPVPNPPVIVGDTVWVVWSYSGGNVVLHGYDAQTLAPTASVLVPAIGPVGGPASNVLTSGPDGDLYVAAGLTVVVVDPATGNLIKRIYVIEGAATSVAVSPDGSTLYVGIGAGGGAGAFQLVVKNLATSTVVNVTRLKGTDSGGNLVATSAGVWGTTGVGMSEWTWFAPSGDLTRAVRIGQGAGAGFASVPSYNGGVVWVGGSHTLTCASPDGQVLDTVTLPTDHSVVEYFGSPAVVGGQAYSSYQDDASQLSGLVRMTPPAVCLGNVSS